MRVQLCQQEFLLIVGITPPPEKHILGWGDGSVSEIFDEHYLGNDMVSWEHRAGILFKKLQRSENTEG